MSLRRLNKVKHLSILEGDFMQVSTRDDLIVLADCPSFLEKKLGRRVHPGTIHRWTRRGVSGVKLETLLVSGRRYTSAEALDRFFMESTKAKSNQVPVFEQTEKRQTRFEKQAEQLGI